MRKGGGDEGPAVAIRGQEIKFDCSMVPCVRVEIGWTAPQPAPTFANWRAVDANGQTVTLTQAEIDRIVQDLTAPGLLQAQPPNGNVTFAECISPCECIDEQVSAWVQGPHTISVDTTMQLFVPTSTAHTVSATIGWRADRVRYIVGRCAHTT